MVSPGGDKLHLAGSEQILAPNSVTLDSRGNVYTTDSDPGKIDIVGVWKYGKKSMAFEPWCTDPLVLKQSNRPSPGANGIGFAPPNSIYVANTDRSLIVHIPVLKDGTAGTAAVVAEQAPPPAVPLLFFPDGLTVDIEGNVYVTIPFATETIIPGPPPPSPLPVGLSPVVKVDTSTGEVTPMFVADLSTNREFFDFPTSIAFGNGPFDKKSVFVASMGAQYFFPLYSGTGPKLTQLAAGVPGAAGQ